MDAAMSGNPDEEITMARRRVASSGDDMLVKSAEFVGWALGGLEREIAQTRERLSALNAHAVQLRARIGKATPPPPAAAGETGKASRKQRRRQMSAEARERISSAMKKRWAERRKRQCPAAGVAPLTAAGRVRARSRARTPGGRR